MTSFMYKPLRRRPVVNFTNFLRTAFTRPDPKSANQCLFVLLGSEHVKTARKTLVKLTPER